MSSRALKKALRERELAEAARREEELAAATAAAAEESEAEEEAESEEDEVVQTARANLFDLLGGGDDDDDNNDGNESDLPSEKEEVKEVKVVAPKKKKKNKKKKGKKEVVVDEIEEALKELDAKGKGKRGGVEESEVATPVEVQPAKDFAVLRLDTKHLDVTHELRRLFGRAAVEDRGEVPDLNIARRGGRGGQQRGGGRSAASASSRRNFLVQPKTSWPPVGSGGLGMELVSRNDEDGTAKYTFVHSGGYKQLQQEFFGFVLTMDHEEIRRMLQVNPYHSSSLLMVAYMMAHERDNATSGDFIERALYNFGRTASVQFTKLLTEGKGRLDFNRFESREFYLAVWKYIHNLGLRGTWRTAEEYGWLLFSLDPEDDPYQAILMLDFLMLKAKSYDRLLSFAQSPAFASRFSQLPNYAYSTALAQLLLGNRALAEEYLRKAITKFPWVVSRMFSALDVQEELPDVLWGVLPPHNMKAQAVYGELYVERTKDLWKLPEAYKLFVDTTLTIYNLPRKLLLQHQPEPSHELCVDGIPLSLARHVYLYDNKSILMSLPDRFSKAVVMDYDPFPPALENSPYSDFLLSGSSEGQYHQASQGQGPLGMGMDAITSLLNRMPGLDNTAIQNLLNQVRNMGMQGGEAEFEDEGDGNFQDVPGAFPVDQPPVPLTALAPAPASTFQNIFHTQAPPPAPLPERNINYYLHHELVYRSAIYTSSASFPPRDQTVHLIIFLLEPHIRSRLSSLESLPGIWTQFTTSRLSNLKYLLSRTDIEIHTLLRELQIHNIVTTPSTPPTTYHLSKEYLESLRDVPDSEYPPNYYDPFPAIARFRRSFIENYPPGSEIRSQELNNLTRTLLGVTPLPGGRDPTKVETYINWVLGVSDGWEGLDKDATKKRRLDIANRLEAWMGSVEWWNRALPVNPLQATVEEASEEEFFSDEEYY